MEYRVTIGAFDRNEFEGPISRIADRSTKNNEKEKWFKEIALRILKKNGFPKLVDGREVSRRQGVPFDLVEKGNDGLSLIEMKGSQYTFNYSKEIQSARLHHVVSELRKRNVIPRIFLLQINLQYDLYQILDSEFYSRILTRIDTKRVGRDIPFIPIVDDLIAWMADKR